MESTFCVTQIEHSEDVCPNDSFKNIIQRKLRNIILVSPYHYKTKINMRSRMLIMKEREKHIESQYHYMIHPFSILILVWEFLVCFLWLGVCFVIPYTPFVHRQDAYYYVIMVITTDMISLIDIVIKFMTGYQQSETREVILDLKKRMINYINDNFVYDIISAIPIHLFVIPLKKQLFEASMLFLKIFRTHCLFRYLNTVLNQLNFDFQTQNIIKLVLQYLLYIQWLTGIYYQVTEIVHVILLKFSVKNWIIQNHMHNKTPAIMRYLTSLYYTTSFLTTSGTGQYVPDCPPDMFIMGCLMIFSIYLVLRLMIWVYTFTLYNSSLKIQYNSIFAELQHFMDRKFLTLKLRKKIYKFINYKWEGIYCVEGKIFNSLSNNLQLQIILCGCEKLLHKSQLFGKFPRSLVLELAKHLQLEIYLNEDILAHPDSVTQCVFFIKVGTLKILNKKEEEVDRLYEGDYFGEKALFDPDTLNHYTVEALEISEVYLLYIKDWQQCLRLYPKVKRSIQKLIPRTSKKHYS